MKLSIRSQIVVIIIYYSILACKREADPLDLNLRSEDQNGEHSQQTSGNPQGGTETGAPVVSSPPVEAPLPAPAPAVGSILQIPPTATIDYGISGIDLVINEKPKDPKCPKLKSLKIYPLGFQIIHGAIGDYLENGKTLVKPEICKITGTALIPAGYYLKQAFTKNDVQVESLLRTGDTLNFNYNVELDFNGTNFYRRYFGRLTSPAEPVSTVKLDEKASSLMSCAQASLRPTKVSFSITLAYQLTSTTLVPDDPAGALILDSPPIEFTLGKCGVP